MATRYNLISEPCKKCKCGGSIEPAHTLSRKVGGFTIIRHNAVRDILGDIIKQSFGKAAAEVELQRVPEEMVFSANSTTRDRSVNTDYNHGMAERSHLDVCVFAPASSEVFSYHATLKNSKYAERISRIEGDVFMMSCHLLVVMESRFRAS
ncbi:hypothetical protein GJ496_008162 [Pomphorhynchus laevis]|nr:hypothetical protein GJ496_008162 [Pomphorhynchus laevis]